MDYWLSVNDMDHNSPALDWLKLGQKMGWVKAVERVSPLQLPDIDQRMQEIFHELEAKKVIKHKYDYAWIMQLIDEKKIEEVAPFKTVPSFRSYLLQLGINVAGVSPVFRNEVTQIGVQGFIPIASSSFVTSSSYSVRSMTDIFFPLYGFTYSILYRLSARNFAR